MNDIFLLNLKLQKSYINQEYYDELISIFGSTLITTILTKQEIHYSALDISDSKITTINCYYKNSRWDIYLGDVHKIIEYSEKINGSYMSFEEYVDSLKSFATQLNVDYFYYSLVNNNLIRLLENNIDIDIKKIKSLINIEP